MNYYNNSITVPSFVLGLKATIQHLFPFCLVAFGPVALPRGDVVHTDESGGQFMPQGTRTANQGGVKVWDEKYKLR